MTLLSEDWNVAINRIEKAADAANIDEGGILTDLVVTSITNAGAGALVETTITITAKLKSNIMGKELLK